MKSIFLLFSVLLFSACSAPQSGKSLSDAVQVSLIYSANLDGELEPCGCSEQGDLGGLKRRAQLLDDMRKQNSNLIALSGGGLIASEGASDQVKSAFILEGFAALQYDAVALQWKDIAFGVDFLAKDKLPWISSNWKDQAFPKRQVIKRQVQGKKLEMHVYAWLDPEASPMRKMLGEHGVVQTDKIPLQQQLKQSHSAGALTVLVIDKPLPEIEQQFDLSAVDVLIIKSAYEEFSPSKSVGNTLVLQAGSRGMRLGKLDFHFDPAAKASRISALQEKVIPMPSSIADAPRMLDWYQRYNDRVKQDYLKRVELRKKMESGVSPYAGEESCESCHPKQYQRWSESEHAKAYEDLEEVGKSFDPACLQCHTVGFEQPGGFFDAVMTSQLTAVQCENCHGAAKAHVDSAGKTPVANQAWKKPQMCAQCHTQPHSPGFDLEKYWPKIAH